MQIIDYIRYENLSVQDYEEIREILGRDILDTPHKTLMCIYDILTYLKVSDDILDEIGVDEITEFVNYFRNTQHTFDLENIPTEIHIGNKTYTCENGLKTELKGMLLRYTFDKIHDKDYASFILACLFKDTSLTNTEHKDKAHIKHKQSLFKKLKFVDYAPYVLNFTQKIIDADKKIIEDVANNKPI